MHFFDIIKLDFKMPVVAWAMEANGTRIAAFNKNYIFSIVGGYGHRIESESKRSGPWCGSIRSPDFESYGIISAKLQNGVLAFCCRNEHIFRWGSRGTSPAYCHRDIVTSFAARGDCYITASQDRTIKRRSTEDGKILARADFDAGSASHMLYQAQDDLIIVVCENGEVALFDAANLGTPLLKWFMYNETPRGLSSAPILMKNTLLVTAGQNGLIDVWDTARGKWGDGNIKPIMTIPAKQVTSMCTAVDDKYLITTARDWLIRIYDSETGKFIVSSTLLEHTPDQIASFHHCRVSDYAKQFVGDEFDLVWSSGGNMYSARVHSKQWMWSREQGFLSHEKPVIF